MKILIFFFLETVAILGYSGCTAIGFGVGAIIDSQKPDYDTIPGWYATSVWRGEDIRLTKKTGEELKGEYLGLETLADSQYALVYNKFRDKYEKEISLPALGDSISIVSLKPAKEYKGKFLGFDDQYIWLRTGIWGSTQPIDMNKIDGITDRNGNPIEVGRLISLSSAGKIPALSTVALKTNSETLNIPTPAVDRIEIPVDKNAKWVGLGTRVIIDLAIIVFFSGQLHDLGSGGWSWSK
jgi:hypothetical protein